MAAQASLQYEWLHGKRGGLSAREQLKAWALREVWNEDLLMKMDADEEWFPGQQYGEKRGRKRVLTGVKALAVANCAQTKTAKGGDLTYGHVCGNCPKAVMSPANRQACG